MNNYSIIYLGDHKQVSLDTEALKSTLKCRFKILNYDKEFQTLFTNIISFSPDVILIEITNVDSDLLSFLILLKSHSKLKSSRIIAIFPDKNNLDQYSDIYSFGVEYGFIAGEESNKIIGDIGIFLDSSKYKPTPYAQAKNLYIPANSQFLAKVSHLSEDDLFIETSLLLKENDCIEATLNFDESLSLKFFKVIQNSYFLPRSCFSSSAKLKILYEGDADLKSEVVGKLSSKKDVINFLANIKPQSYLRNDPALIIDNRPDTLANLIYELNVNNRYIKITNSYSDFEDQFSIFLPQIICFQMDLETEDMAEDDCLRVNGPTTFNLLIQKIKSISGYDPYILVFHEKSRNQAYRKAHSYEKIIVNKKSFELNYLSMIIDEFQKNHPVSGDVIYLKPPDPKTIIKIHKELIITSISENQLTFLYEGDLNTYSTFKLSDPLNIYVTIIPSDQVLESKKSHKHYLGLITNTSEEEKMELRKLVNLLIKVELSEGETFTLKSVRDLREDIIKSKTLELKKMRIVQKTELALKKLEEESDQD